MKIESVVLRLAIITGIALLLLIPLFMIQSLINERESYRDEAVEEINKSWSTAQVIGGPLLTIQKEVQNVAANGDKHTGIIRKQVLPEELNVNCRLLPEIRYRGIYEVVLYKSKISAKGFFLLPEKSVNNNEDYIISLNMSDLRGIEDKVLFKWNGEPKEVNPGINNSDVFPSGVSINIDNISSGKYNFELEFTLKGSGKIEFLPLGKTTDIIVQSGWNNPSFTGAYLPSEREITKDGFNAKWKINYFNRSYPQVWEGNNFDVFKSAFGVRLLMSVDEYQKTMRSSKYGILIVVLTFVSFFMIELFSRKAIHPIQYLLTGISLILFYSLLLSLSEYVIFSYSYLITALFVILLIGLYIKSIYQSYKLAGLMVLLLITFYGFIYVILQLQDYSLLLGNIALFIILAVIMYLTRNINWFEVLNNRTNKV